MQDPYQTNTIVFCSSQFYVDKRVYVPTKETEQLVQRASNYILTLPKNPLIIDVGTGSGAIGITLAKQFPRAQVIGVDISEDALAVAEINRQKQCVANYSTRLSDYVSSVSESPDVIIADLPWGSKEYLLGSNSLVDWKNMPEISFFPPDGDPMGRYKQLVKQILEKKWTTQLFMETGVMPEELVKSSLSQIRDIQYILINRHYSITEINFTAMHK